jgi:hypothetical protein
MQQERKKDRRSPCRSFSALRTTLFTLTLEAEDRAVDGIAKRASLANDALSREPFSIDPALVERGLRGHSDTQNEHRQRL